MKIFSAKETAALLGLAYGTFRDYRAKGRPLPEPIYVGKRAKYTLEAIAAYLANNPSPRTNAILRDWSFK